MDRVHGSILAQSRRQAVAEVREGKEVWKATEGVSALPDQTTTAAGPPKRAAAVGR